MTERVLPREFNTPPELLIPLSNAELTELGTFSAIWSQIDFAILVLVAHLSKTEISPTQLIMENMTTGPRVNLLKKLCQEEPTEVKKAIKKVLDDNGGLFEDRNHVVHGIWGIYWDYTAGTTKAASMYQKNKRAPIFAAKLTTLSDRAASLSNALGALLEKLNPLFAGDRPRPFFFGEGNPEGRAEPPWPPE